MKEIIGNSKSCIVGAARGGGTLYSVYVPDTKGSGRVYHWVEGLDDPRIDPRKKIGAVTLCAGEGLDGKNIPTSYNSLTHGSTISPNVISKKAAGGSLSTKPIPLKSQGSNLYFSEDKNSNTKIEFLDVTNKASMNDHKLPSPSERFLSDSKKSYMEHPNVGDGGFNNTKKMTGGKITGGNRTRPVIDNSSKRGDTNKLQGGSKHPCPVGTTRSADGSCFK